mmetsp:Transcript_21618/g.38362  ORF Transcript_21618/g.38362 Transcript_21618/m.38362 type:complete len:216 (+) Transcript_21618:155-802(+)|eukprot:CAMPEP_0197516450 /NCGR_PEP_ID=MMETSP1318-20131121/1330_1 /TAXON_ID=552666 /ORGANISM="Partenskyella glossopodia, Strain RCC365" /LENGTH=215 /DNA_ID=CAMNT_0043065205 /DNA_START=101 /DNA_END=748 /DNA_ORIENTATION=-
MRTAARSIRYMLRRAARQDYPGIVKIQEANFESARERTSVQGLLNEDFLNPSLQKYVIAARPWAENNGSAIYHPGDQVVSYILYEFQAVHFGVHVMSIATCPNHQQKGFARDLMQWCAYHSKERGLDFADLRVRPSNTPALNFYESLGYKEFARDWDYYSTPVEDAVRLKMDLSHTVLEQPRRIPHQQPQPAQRTTVQESYMTNFGIMPNLVPAT